MILIKSFIISPEKHRFLRRPSSMNGGYNKVKNTTVKLSHVSPDIGEDIFSAYHPMIPKRYVPPWQLDMKNRTRTLEVLVCGYKCIILHIITPDTLNHSILFYSIIMTTIVI